ncbi:MAG: ribulose-phosphate 3-epimerase [Dictyoglomi bacterium]|nr:ribulose-phosphate 3-epimerase [Dictyoglomota bacterium]
MASQKKEEIRNLAPVIEPSILSADFVTLGNAIQTLIDNGLKMLHIDVMDGHFVPNLAIGPQILGSLKKHFPDIIYSVHLMIEHPAQYIDVFADAGADIVTVHVEAENHLDRTLNYIKDKGLLAGVSLNPATPISAIQMVMPFVDVILVMTVNPGFGGQKLIPYALDKVRVLSEIRREPEYNYLIEVDGGVKHHNLENVLEKGADLIVMGSAIMGASDVKEAFVSAENIAESFRR